MHTTTIHNDHTYIIQTYQRPPFILEHGKGVYLYDTNDTPYLDFVAGIGVNALGYGDSEVIATITEQAARLIHVSNLYHTRPGPELAKLLIQNSPGFDRVFFSNSGSEAVEGSLKFARKYARQNYGEGKTTIIACEGSFHGRTMGAIATTSREKYRLPFMPVMPDVHFVPLNDTAALDAAFGDHVCAVIIEPVQGEGGLCEANDDFLAHIRERCDEHAALMIVDEIQCGMGRTGTLWAHEASGIQPDIMTVAKPLGGGMPIGAVLVQQRVADALAAGDHGTTFGGGPLVTAVAQVVLRRISDPFFLDHVRDVATYLEQALHTLAANKPETIVELRGRGLMRGIRINGSAAAVRSACHDAGLLVATAGDDVIRLLPPLIIEQQHVDEAIEKLISVL